MARGRTTSLTIRLAPAERLTLLAWQRSVTISAGLDRRGRIIVPPGRSDADHRHCRHTWGQPSLYLQVGEAFCAGGSEGLAAKLGRGYWHVPRLPLGDGVW